jgi:TolB-like protein/tetratricopeptide (TPR) repeat protein
VTNETSPPVRFLRELRRRRVFRTAGLYVVGAWLVMQAADVFFPGWGLADSAINILLFAAILGFPLALVFGWFYDITTHGIVRTQGRNDDDGATHMPLRGPDYLVLGALLLIAGAIVYNATRDILETPRLAQTNDDAMEALLPIDSLANSIAVLPFANISNEPENEVFCDGISEEILLKLGAFADLHVIGRTSSFAFKGSDYRIPRIAALLGVRYLLQGSVRKYGDQLRISAQLVDDSGEQKWSDSYDRTLQNIFAIQTEIADVVAETVAPQISPDHAGEYEPGIAAYEHFLSGRDLLHKRDFRAVEEFRLALELDPDFAEVHAEYAIALMIGMPDREGLEMADRLIERALTLQPGLPRAMAARGLWYQQKTPPDREASEAILLDVLERSPNMVDALNWMGNAVRNQGRDEEADVYSDRAASLDPFHGAIAVNRAMRYARDGDLARAEKTLIRFTEIPNPAPFTFVALENLYWNSGQLVKMNELSKRQALKGLHHYYGLTFNYAPLGNWPLADYWARRNTRDFPKHGISKWSSSFTPFWQGQYAESARDMERTIADHGIDIKSEPPMIAGFYAQVLAYNREYEEALAVFQAVLGETPSARHTDYYDINMLHAFAWTYDRLGYAEKAMAILDSVDALLAIHTPAGNAESSIHYEWATNALLRGDPDLALDRLEQAVANGYRSYNIDRHDPHWETMQDNPRYQALMAEVMADVDRQRAIVEQSDSEEDFIAVLDAVQAAQQPEPSN